MSILSHYVYLYKCYLFVSTTKVCAPRPESEDQDYEVVAEPQKRKSSLFYR